MNLSLEQIVLRIVLQYLERDLMREQVAQVQARVNELEAQLKKHSEDAATVK